MGQHVGALTQERKRLQQVARDSPDAGTHAPRPQARGGRFNAAPASYGQGKPRHVGWGGVVQYPPDGRPQCGGPGGKGGKGSRPFLFMGN